MFQSVGLEFVPNNYAAPLSTENAPEAFHLFQNFLTQSDIRQALVEPTKLSGLQIKAFWETGVYDDGGEAGTPSIIFEFDEQEYVVTPTTVRDALGFEDFNAYTIYVGDAELQRMMKEIGYSGSLARTGNLKRPLLRKEWSFFFDCITRAFGKKCTNWDAIPIDSLQIGYSLLYDAHFDFARLVLNNIGEKMTENRGVVYFARFCQLIFSTCVHEVNIIEDDVIPLFKLHKRVFSDLTNKDVKKGNVGDLLLPASIQQFLQPQPQLNSEPLPSTSQRPKAGGRTKHRAFKAAKPSVANDLPNSVGTSRKKKRANRPTSNEDRDSDVNESIHTKKRKLVAAYLFGGLIPDSTTAEAPEVVIEDISDNATVPEEARANTDDNAVFNDDFLEPIMEMDIEENIEAHPTATLEEFGSIGETEDVAGDQPTVIIDESLATHTKVLSVTHQVLEKGEEVDQTTKVVAAETDLDETAENNFEANAEIVIEVTTEPVIEVVQEENVQENINSEKLAHEDAQETFAENIPHSPSAESSAKSDDQADSSSQRLSAQPNPKETDVGGSTQHNTELHFQNMYFSKWSNKDCIFTDQRAADFMTKSADSITNPELLTHLKATIVQVKSLHNHFDETQKSVTGLRNDVVVRDMSLKQDKSMLLTLVKDQEVIKNRLSKVEENQTVMSDKLDSIATSLELLTSVLIPDDVKKGERILKDKCKKSQTLSRRDDSTDGGAKGKELKSKSTQQQGRLKSNSATNSERINTGAQSSSRARSLLLTSQPITDEEIVAQLFLEEHGADATIEDIQAEELMLAEEHERNLKSGKSLQQAKRAVETKLDKGKGKFVEEHQIMKKAQTTSDNAQVVQTLEAVTTSDSTQVVQTQLSSQLQRTFAKPITVQHSLIPANVNILQNRTIMGKESRDKSGLGSHREKRVNNSPVDQTSLAEPGVGVTQENLDTLESVQLIHHRGLKKDFLLYFKSDGRVYRVGEADIGLKMKEELEALCGLKTAGSYIPKYRDYNGKLVEMQRNSARLRTDLGIKVLEFNLESDKSFIIKLGNDMRKNSIYALRVAIYQTGESDPELKELKKIMVVELERAGRRLLMDYIRTVPDIEEIK
ncbi:hypothetical protein POM88_002098 [Heracleum sosnowskyi]|uniref:Uncharacterized protein n=1 Tax=Heracleum sosnowskyi TaxID=360622 RepID=A0AAD8JG81_9APIA|nr:hypothetical protein POM88_002098 [Heracleum sosnowskyi]